MFSKIKVASGLLCVLAAFCFFQLVTVGLGFWSLTRTHDDVGDLSNVALKQVDAVAETTQRLMDARINLSRAGTRMVRGGAEPADIVQHAREQLAAADQSFAAFTSAPKTSDENSARAAALADRYQKYHAALVELGQFLDANNIQAFLDQPTAARGTNEIGHLFSGLAKMQASVARTVQTVRESADSIHLGADEIATGNADLSARTENQAASLEETASSMEELTATVRQNAEHAREANTLAETALSATSRGSEVVNEVVDKMRGIAQSSDKIAEIISVIDGIAFQTNILALNAAVEAARAGEQGRGFAVVAGEVRGLAQRSAQSAKEIKTLISESVAEIQGGSTLVEHAGEAMRNVSASISRVTQMMAEISTSSREQSTGIEQVNQAVVQMDEMTQQNAALVEQAAAAAASLHQQTQQLKDAVSVFEISDAVLRTQHTDDAAGRSAGFAWSGMRAV